MSIEKKQITSFLELIGTMPVLDVRSPGEYLHAHIPGSDSFPIFSDIERKEIGTAYKQKSRETAIKIGLGFFGNNLLLFVEKVESILQGRGYTSKAVALHCWRGGMRSAAMAWLLDLYGFKVYLLVGGYKAYRNWALEEFSKPYSLNIISGYTGSNKTGIISEIQQNGLPALDLEKMASHKGSAFGNLGMPQQPGQEMFENLLAFELFQIQKKHPNQPIFVEDESQRIGNVNIPTSFFGLMREQNILFLRIDFEERLKFIVETYGIHDKEKLLAAIERIRKKLGGKSAEEAGRFLREGDTTACFRILLEYYDRLYLKSTSKRKKSIESIKSINLPSTDPKENLKELLKYVRS